MLIEYTIKIDKKSLTITQRVESGALAQQVKPRVPVKEKVLAATLAESLAASSEKPQPAAAPEGGGGTENGDGGRPTSNNLGTCPIFFIGPIIFGGTEDENGGGPVTEG